MQSLVHQPVRPALLGGFEASARNVRRTGRRLTRVGLFSIDTLTRLRTARFEGPVERARELGWVAENLAALHGLHIRAHGTAPAGPALLVANHISYLDPLVICSHAPAIPVAKYEVRHWPGVGEITSRLGSLFVRRGCAYSGATVLRQGMRALESGARVLVFPEGTTTRGHSVLPMLRGAFGMAAQAGVPIVPVALHYDDPAAAWVGGETFVPHYMRTTLRPCTSVHMDVLEPLHPTAADEPAALAEEVRARILAAIEQRQAARLANAHGLHAD